MFGQHVQRETTQLGQVFFFFFLNSERFHFLRFIFLETKVLICGDCFVCFLLLWVAHVVLSKRVRPL